MKKKVMAVAVAGVLAAPALAFAQASTVQIYGYLNAEYGFARGLDRAAGKTNNWDGLNSAASYIGFKGEEKLGGGMSAFFQCETDVLFLKGDQTAAPLHTQTLGSWCTRNSAVGLKGGFGSFYVGNWDSPTKRAVGSARITGETGWHGVQSLLISNGGAFTGSFSVRNSNSINWDSPNWNGFSASLQTTSTKEAATVATAGLKGRHTSGSVSYASGPMMLVGAYTKADDNRAFPAAAAATSITDSVWVLGGTYVWGPAKVGVLYIKGKAEPTATTECTYAFGGPPSAFAGYTLAGDTKFSGVGAAPAATGNDTGAKEYMIGYKYAFSKRTSAGVSYARVKNDTNAVGYTVGAQATAVLAGSSSSVVITRLEHSF